MFNRTAFTKKQKKLHGKKKNCMKKKNKKNLTILHFAKTITLNETCLQNHIKFTKDPKETKILIKILFTIHQKN
jgi:hypothetical protein